MLNMFRRCRFAKLRYINIRDNSTKSAVKGASSSQTPTERPPAAAASAQDPAACFDQLSKMRLRTRERQPQRAPFVKNLFLANVDLDMLAFPQVLGNAAEVDELFSSVRPIDEFFQSTGEQDGKQSDLHGDNCMSTMQRLQLVGLRTAQTAGGRELSVTEACRFQESMMCDGASNGVVAHDLLGVAILQQFASDAQRQQYLDGVLSGRLVTAFCVNEAHDINSVTRAVFHHNPNNWTLNGHKALVLNANRADLFIILAETDKGKCTAFLVEKTTPGIRVTNSRRLGLESTDIANVKFDNVVVSTDNILGTLHKSNQVVSAVFPEYRLSSGTTSIAVCKQLAQKFAAWCKDQEPSQTDLMAAESMFTVTADMAMTIYATESMTYMTAGLMDLYEKQDCDLEAAIVKAFSIESMHRNVVELMGIIGSPAFLDGHWCNKIYRDATTYLLLNESLKSIKLTIALLGLQYAGIHMQQRISKLRNPLFHPLAMLDYMMVRRRHENDNPKLNLGLKFHLHPSLRYSADVLEYSVLRLNYATEVFLSRYGHELITKHNDLERLANATIDIYAVAACLARASRSYCIGLRNADGEIMTANAITMAAKDRIRRNLNAICEGPYTNNDDNCRQLGEKFLKTGQYYLEHPITRNF